MKIERAGLPVWSSFFGSPAHAEVEGLRPFREYYYRFKAGDEISSVGRTKTAPEIGAPLSELAFASCQLYETGYYTAYRDMVRQDLDLIVHLGDYNYAETYLGGPRFVLTKVPR